GARFRYLPYKIAEGQIFFLQSAACPAWQCRIAAARILWTRASEGKPGPGGDSMVGREESVMAVTAPEANEETMAMRVVGALRDEIVTMALKPGDVISESDIAGRYGVSRQPVREAFIRLAQQGLLLIRPKRATVVKKISPDGVRQSRFIRESIEVE